MVHKRKHSTFIKKNSVANRFMKQGEFLTSRQFQVTLNFLLHLNKKFAIRLDTSVRNDIGFADYSVRHETRKSVVSLVTGPIKLHYPGFGICTDEIEC